MAAYADEYPHSTLSYGAFGRDFIKDFAESDRPFCLSISFKAPHHPVQPDPKFDDVYEGVKFTKPGNFGRDNGQHLAPQSRLGRQYERFHSWNYSTKYNQTMALYYQQIYAIDVAVGMIRDALKSTDEAKNTVIIYTSDNGFMNGSHGYGSKVIPYEESSRVPLIVLDPRSPSSGKGRRCDALTGNVDFAPTILGLAGIPTPENVDGADLMTLYRDPGAMIHSTLPLINVWGPDVVNSLGVVTKRWKYIYWPHEVGEHKPTEELFETGADPLEMRNLASDERAADDLVRMRALYDQLVTDWKNEAVPYHNYQEFGDVFSRN